MGDARASTTMPCLYRLRFSRSLSDTAEPAALRPATRRRRAERTEPPACRLLPRPSGCPCAAPAALSLPLPSLVPAAAVAKPPRGPARPHRTDRSGDGSCSCSSDGVRGTAAPAPTPTVRSPPRCPRYRAAVALAPRRPRRCSSVGLVAPHRSRCGCGWPAPLRGRRLWRVGQGVRDGRRRSLRRPGAWRGRVCHRGIIPPEHPLLVCALLAGGQQRRARLRGQRGAPCAASCGSPRSLSGA